MAAPDVREARLALGRAAVLPVSRAAALLPLRDSEAREAIEAAGIVRLLAGKRVVVWGDVLDCVLTAEQEREPAPNPRPTRLPRSPL